MNPFAEAILLALLVGAGGTAIGAAAAIWIKVRSKRLSAILLGLASGIMLSVVILDMIPESLEEGGTGIFFIGLGLGALVMGLASHASHHTHAEEEEEAEKAASSLKRIGILLAAGVSIHNLPQGIAIGSGVGAAAGFIYSLSILLLLHNIPEGMAMCLPLRVGHATNGRIMTVALLTAVPTVVGAILGVLLSEISGVFVGASLAFAAGSMLYLTVIELIPQSLGIGSRKDVLFSAVLGFIVGGLVIWILEH